VKQNRDGEGLHTGMGRWTRSNSEPCLLATRGNPLRLDMGVHQVIETPVGEHSEKPAEAPARIERLLAGSYLELFARAERPGWTTWGNEVPPPRTAAAPQIATIGNVAPLPAERERGAVDAYEAVIDREKAEPLMRFRVASRHRCRPRPPRAMCRRFEEVNAMWMHGEVVSIRIEADPDKP
jgi:hypothetical protein